MKILGIGTICGRGFGIDALERALEEGWTPPAELQGGGRAYQASFDDVPDKSLLKSLRRADRLSKMSVLAASAAVADSGLESLAERRVGIILATAYGAHVTTFDFLDGILDYGESAVSPTTFSSSVHNAAASYITTSLSVKGPTLTVTRFRFSFQEALQLARGWLKGGRCDYVLVGGVDQYGTVLGQVSARKLAAAEEGRITPFDFGNCGHVPGEGAAFFLLGREATAGAYCSVHRVSTSGPAAEMPADLDVIDADGQFGDESLYRSLVAPGRPVAAYSPLFGTTMTGSAFGMAAAALMLKRQRRYASPVAVNPHGLPVLTETGGAPLDAIRCLGVSCDGGSTEMILKRLT